MSFTVLTAFPFAIGYGLSVFLIGSTYRMPWSILIAYVATLLGAMLSFLFCRSFLKDHVHRIMSQSEHFAFASHVIKKHPVKVSPILSLSLSHPASRLFMIVFNCAEIGPRSLQSLESSMRGFTHHLPAPFPAGTVCRHQSRHPHAVHCRHAF
jgi:hypothetical protein